MELYNCDVMIITSLKLQNYRNHTQVNFNFGKKVVIVGDNGVGKTNVLEAIYMLAVGKSFRADDESELIKYGETFASVEGIVDYGSLRIFLSERKRFEVNGVARRMVDFTGKFKAVFFGPADIEIVTGNPSARRKYLNFVLSQKDREYHRSLLSYEKGLRQRNKLLDFIRDGTAGKQQLWFWDKLLIKDGGYVTEQREKYLREFNGGYDITYDKSIISEERLKKYENEEVAAGNTLVGPHRDDFFILSDGKDISKFGSRGQQRMAVLAMKMWELEYLSDKQSLPVLLLDDIFSELDHKHRDEVLKLLVSQTDRGGQVIMTTADKHLVPTSVDWQMLQLL